MWPSDNTECHVAIISIPLFRQLHQALNSGAKGLNYLLVYVSSVVLTVLNTKIMVFQDVVLHSLIEVSFGGTCWLHIQTHICSSL